MVLDATAKYEGKAANRLIGKILPIAVIRITPDPANLRETFDIEDIKDLGLNMKSIGQLDEIIVFPKIDADGNWIGTFDLHDGERRWRAAKSVGIKELVAKIIERPSDKEILLKRTSRALQTRTLDPLKKVEAVRIALTQLDVVNKPELWESYRQQLGGGEDWPQIIRVLKAQPLVKQMLEDGVVNFTLAQSIGRLPLNKQEEAAKYVVTNKLSGRFFSTQMIPYLLENQDASLPQAFEFTRVGGWRQYVKSPYLRGEQPATEEQLDEFLEACVKWEHAWEVVVHTGLILSILGDSNYESRIKEALHRILERAQSMLKKFESKDTQKAANGTLITETKLLIKPKDIK